MPLFTVLFTCSYVLYKQINKLSNKHIIITNSDSIFYEEIYNSVNHARQAIYGIFELITMAVTHNAYVNKHRLIFSDKLQVIPTYDTGDLPFEIDFQRNMCPFLLKLLFNNSNNLTWKDWKDLYSRTVDKLQTPDASLLSKLLEYNSNILFKISNTSTQLELTELYYGLLKIYLASHTLAFVCLELFSTFASNFISYKSLIDNLWRYLYDPYANWAKFKQLSCFLLATHSYILKKVNKECSGDHGYYDQLYKAVNEEKLFKLGTVATTNYAPLIKNRLFKSESEQFHDENYYFLHNTNEPVERKLVYLNGSTSFIYNPLLNEIHEKEMSEQNKSNDVWIQYKQINIPLLFTQSGIKAMTVVEINDMYASLFRNWLVSDAVVLVGFNCGKDDIHINAMLRKFLKLTNKQKPIVIVTRAPKAPTDQALDELRRKFAEKLHLDKEYLDCLLLVGITKIVSNQAPEEEQQLNNTVNGVVWYKKLYLLLKQWHEEHQSINTKEKPRHSSLP